MFEADPLAVADHTAVENPALGTHTRESWEKRTADLTGASLLARLLRRVWPSLPPPIGPLPFICERGRIGSDVAATLGRSVTASTNQKAEAKRAAVKRATPEQSAANGE